MTGQAETGQAETGQAEAGQAEAGQADARRAELVTAAQERWAAALTDLGGRNTLLYYKDRRAGTLDLAAAAPEALDRLQRSGTVRLTRLFHEVEDKSHQLEIASRHKSDFLAGVSHELRTPMNAILGFNEMILGDIYGEVPEDIRVPLTDIQNSGKHLLRLINNVLDLSKIEAGRMELAVADYSVQDTVESVRSSLASLAAQKGLDLAASVQDDIPLVRGDAGRISQCLMNLVGNALKFSSPEIKSGFQMFGLRKLAGA